MQKSETVRSPAKVNLFLRVKRRRPDGYHDIESLICCVSLFDDLQFVFNTERISVACGHPDVPENEGNLAYRAASLFFQRLGVDAGVKISIQKRIPVGAGLGGGSSNAATVLSTLNRRYGRPFDKASLASMGAMLGADVPFFVYGSPAVATGIGETITPFPDISPMHLLLVYPRFCVSTRWVYQNLNLALTKKTNQHKYRPLKDRQFDARRHLFNDLERVTEPEYPVISEIKIALLASGAFGALMSGSGPTVFGCYMDPVVARSAYLSVSGRRQWDVFLAETIV